MAHAPSYSGFAWDHPLMVHWRKAHPVNPGFSRVLRGASLEDILAILSGVALIAISIFTTEARGFFVGLGSFLLGWAISDVFNRDRAADQLEHWSGATELDELLKQLRKLLEIPHGVPGASPGLDVIPWSDLQKRARRILIACARDVLVQEKNEKDPMRFESSRLRAEFKTRFDVFGRAGLIESGQNGHQPFFSAAQDHIASDAIYPPGPEPHENGSSIDLAPPPLE